MMKGVLLSSEVNIICVAILFIIAFDIKKSEFNHGMRPVLLSKYIGFVSAFYLLDIFNNVPYYIISAFPGIVTYILFVLYMLTFAISGYYWFTYSEIIHNRSHLTDVKWRVITAIPVFVLMILYIVSYYNGCMFAFDKTAGYIRGRLIFIQPAVSFGYIFASTVRCLCCVPGALSTSNRRDLINYVYYSVFSLICGFLQFLLGNFSILIIGNTCFVLIVYFNYTGKLISNDPLTGIPNRRKLMHYLAAEIQQLKSDEELWFLFADIDNFKQINDKYGHMEGDRILKEITIAMKEFCKKRKCFCARFGGDEFAVVQKLKVDTKFSVPEDLRAFIKEKNILVNNKYALSASLGYTKYNRNDHNINDMIKRADKEMYNAKLEVNSNGGVTLAEAIIKYINK